MRVTASRGVLIAAAMILLVSCGGGGKDRVEDGEAHEDAAGEDAGAEEGADGEDIAETAEDRVQEEATEPEETAEDPAEVPDAEETDEAEARLCEADEVYGIMVALIEGWHAAIEAEDLPGLMALIETPAYDPSADLSFLNAWTRTLPETQAYFTEMFASLQDIAFGTLVTGDGLGNPYALADENTAYVADFTSLDAVVENPAGGYLFVDTLEAGDPWHEDKSEDWYSFRFVCSNGGWAVQAFGIGNQ